MLNVSEQGLLGVAVIEATAAATSVGCGICSRLEKGACVFHEFQECESSGQKRTVIGSIYVELLHR